ncbi:MAG TPA: hypothetical protein VMF33_05920 [Acidimicrobiales bacterium]|nr:hypothetical protein [Acidimicrobiales bacterium]
MTSLDQSSQRSLRADQMVLTDDLIERLGPQQFGERRGRAEALARGFVKE